MKRVTILILAVALPVLAHETKKKSGMHGMMRMCQEHCGMRAAALNTTAKQVQEARASKDLAKKNKALDAAHTLLSEMHHHVSSCMKMMETMPMHMGGTAAAPPTAEATSTAAREVRVNVSGGFSPERVEVRQGEPLRLVFLRDEKPTCATEVVFPSLNVRRELPVGETVSIEITPTKAGDLIFTCGMNMLRGKLVVLEQ